MSGIPWLAASLDRVPEKQHPEFCSLEGKGGKTLSYQ